MLTSTMNVVGASVNLGQRVLGVTKDELSTSIDKPHGARRTPDWQSIEKYPVDPDSSSSADSNDTCITCEDSGDELVHLGNNRRILALFAEEGYEGDRESCTPSVTTRGVKGDQKDIEFWAIDDTPEDDTEEFRYLLSSNEYVELHVSTHVTHCKGWAKVIEVSCTYSGVEVANASGHLICRDLIREDFYKDMETLGKPTSDRIDELLDHHGYFRWSIKEYYLRQDPDMWNDEEDKGSILQIDEVLVNKEWQRQPLGSLMVKCLVDRVGKWDCDARFAFVLPSTGCFWKVEETGIKAFDNSQSWAEQNYECVFLRIGFTRVAETAWFVLDITLKDEHEDIESASEQKLLVNGL